MPELCILLVWATLLIIQIVNSTFFKVEIRNISPQFHIPYQQYCAMIGNIFFTKLFSLGIACTEHDNLPSTTVYDTAPIHFHLTRVRAVRQKQAPFYTREIRKLYVIVDGNTVRQFISTSRRRHRFASAAVAAILVVFITTVAVIVAVVIGAWTVCT